MTCFVHEALSLTHSLTIFPGMDTSEQDMHNIVIFTGTAYHCISSHRTHRPCSCCLLPMPLVSVIKSHQYV